MDVFAHVCMCGQKADTSSNYCDNIQPYVETFLFLSNVIDTILDCFFLKLPQFHTSNFRKVVRQQTEGMVESIIWVLLEIYLAFQQWTNFENPLRIDKVMAMSLVYYFFGTQCIVRRVVPRLENLSNEGIIA